jgi:hypothetical protein
VSVARLQLAGETLRVPNFMRWEKPDYRGALDYYCARTHEWRYADKTRGKLKAKLQEKPDDPESTEPSQLDLFLAARDKCIGILVKYDRLPPEFTTMLLEAPKSKVEKVPSKYEHRKRGGKNFRLDIFTKHFRTSTRARRESSSRRRTRRESRKSG